MNLADTLIEPLIGALIGLFAGIIGTRIWRWKKDLHPARKILDTVKDDSEQLKIFIKTFPISSKAPIPDRTEGRIWILENMQEITSVASARCVSFILAFLTPIRSFKNIEIISSERLRDSDLDSHVICIGGPLTNEVTRKIFELPGVWFPYKFGDGGIKRIEGTEKWIATTSTDYGVIIKTENPLSPKKWIFIFAGLFGDASVGSSYFFQARFRDLAKQFGNKSFGIIIKVNRELGYTSAIQIDQVKQDHAN